RRRGALVRGGGARAPDSPSIRRDVFPGFPTPPRIARPFDRTTPRVRTMPLHPAVGRHLLVALVFAGVCAAGRAQSRFERISVSNSAAEANGNITGNDAVVSADGRYVAWDTYASNLSPYDINGTVDVFVRDRW